MVMQVELKILKTLLYMALFRMLLYLQTPLLKANEIQYIIYCINSSHNSNNLFEINLWNFVIIKKINYQII